MMSIEDRPARVPGHSYFICVIQAESASVSLSISSTSRLSFLFNRR
jgi:hypothetical protein